MTSPNYNRIRAIADLLGKSKKHPNTLSFIVNSQRLTVSRVSAMAKTDFTVTEAPDLNGLSLKKMMSSFARATFGCDLSAVRAFVRLQYLARKRLSTGEQHLLTTDIEGDPGRRCITVEYTAIPEVTGDVLAYAVVIETSLLLRANGTHNNRHLRFISIGNTSKFIYTVDPFSCTVSNASQEAIERFSRLGIQNLIGMDIYPVICRCASKLYRYNRKYMVRFAAQQLRAWIRLLKSGLTQTTQHVFKWGNSGGGKHITVVFDVITDACGNIECYTVAVTTKIIDARQYQELERQGLLFIPSP